VTTTAGKGLFFTAHEGETYHREKRGDPKHQLAIHRNSSRDVARKGIDIFAIRCVSSFPASADGPTLAGAELPPISCYKALFNFSGYGEWSG